MDRKYYFPATKTPFLPFMASMLFILPGLGYFYSVSIKNSLPGLLFILFLWIIFTIPVVKHFLEKNNDIKISGTNITISYKNNIVALPWSEIEKFGFQALMSKRMGVYETLPYLAIKLNPAGLEKINKLKSSKEFGFILKNPDLESYLAPEKMDLYINLKNSLDKDEGLEEFLNSKPNFQKQIKPLIKTSDQSEYDEIFSKYFSFAANS